MNSGFCLVVVVVAVVVSKIDRPMKYSSTAPCLLVGQNH